jgi:hypothetical protein
MKSGCITSFPTALFLLPSRDPAVALRTDLKKLLPVDLPADREQHRIALHALSIGAVRLGSTAWLSRLHSMITALAQRSCWCMDIPSIGRCGGRS